MILLVNNSPFVLREKTKVVENVIFDKDGFIKFSWKKYSRL